MGDYQWLSQYFFYDGLTLNGCFYSCDVRNNVDWSASSEQDHVTCKTSSQSFADTFGMHYVFEQLLSLDQEVLTLYTIKFNANSRRATNMRKLAVTTFESFLRSMFAYMYNLPRICPE